MRRSLKISLLIILSVCFGPFIYGALGSTFWKIASDRNDGREVAQRLYSRTGLHPGYDAVVHYSSSNCEEPENTAGWDVRISAYSDFFSRWTSSRYEDAIVSNLRELPSPILGALDGCISGSPLSPICMDYVRQRATRTIRSLESLKANWLVEGEKNIRMAWPQWCQKAQDIFLR